MRCPTLAELPPPPPGKIGWPWSIESPPLPAVRPNSSPWPTISIVTPSFNQGQFIEETIRSILLQGYPALDYIVVDGGSSDESVSVIKKYERWLAYWVSEKDSGQADAINKGVARASGELFNWVNSDDLLLPSALQEIATNLANEDLVTAPIVLFGTQKEAVERPAALTAENLTSLNKGTFYLQLSSWYRLAQFKKAGLLDESLHYAFDLDHVIRYLYDFPIVSYLEKPIGRFRLHSESKTCADADKWPDELLRMHAKLSSDERYGRISQNCKMTIKRYGSLLAVSRIRESTESKVRRVLRLIALIIAQPHLPLARFALGAVREILFRADIAR